MEEKIAKIAGWFLLIVGVTIIGGTLFYSYNIFTARKPMPTIFIVEKPIATFESTGGNLEEQMGEMIKQALGDQIGSLIPADTVTKMLNLFAWSICASILIFGGSQIANLGIKLIKK